MIFLAHRGLWHAPDERNTRAALRAAFAAGFGAETDVRDQNGRLVIAHDMAVGECLPFAAVLADWRAAGLPGRLAINVKADGLAAVIAAELAAVEGATARAFVFDMSVPDTLGYLSSGIPVFTRHSEFEPLPPLETRTAGTWFDCFERPWVDPARVTADLRRGRLAAIVSPELHKRTVHETFWALLRAELATLPPELTAERLMLCTDFPVEAAAFFERSAA